jgi:hypothetical protein
MPVLLPIMINRTMKAPKRPKLREETPLYESDLDWIFDDFEWEIWQLYGNTRDTNGEIHKGYINLYLDEYHIQLFTYTTGFVDVRILEYIEAWKRQMLTPGSWFMNTINNAILNFKNSYIADLEQQMLTWASGLPGQTAQPAMTLPPMPTAQEFVTGIPGLPGQTAQPAMTIPPMPTAQPAVLIPAIPGATGVPGLPGRTNMPGRTGEPGRTGAPGRTAEAIEVENALSSDVNANTKDDSIAITALVISLVVAIIQGIQLVRGFMCKTKVGERHSDIGGVEGNEYYIPR